MTRAIEAFERPTARFWVWENGGWVKLSLKPNRKLSWGKSWRHEEGWSSEYCSWEYEPRWEGPGGEVEDAKVHRVYGTDGCDCDGRLSRWAEDWADLGELGVVDVPVLFEHPWPLDIGHREYWEIQRGIPQARVNGIRVPRWQEQTSGQRDYAAEAMGY